MTAQAAERAGRGPGLTVRGLVRAGIETPDFELAGGEALAVLGPSGSGKTLFLRALADLDENAGMVASGDLRRDAVAAPAWRRRVTYVAAESGWWHEGVSAHFDDWDVVAPVARRLGLPAEAGGWPVSRLSTGERQRLALLRALEGAPAVLLLDEPTSGLDREATAAVEALLAERLMDGVTVVLSTHDRDQAKRIAARCLLFRKGGAAALGPCP